MTSPITADLKSKRLLFLCAFVAIALAARDSVVQLFYGANFHRWSGAHVVYWNITGWLLWLPFGLLVYRLSIRLDIKASKRLWLMMLPLPVVLSVAQAMLHTITDWLPFASHEELCIYTFLDRISFQRLAWGIEVSSLMLFFCYGILAETRRKQTESNATAIEKQLQQRKLQKIRTSLQPAFVLNTLRSASLLIDKDPEAADSLLASLADYLRLLLRASNRKTSTLKDELDLLECYLEITNSSSKRALDMDFHIDNDAYDLAVEPLSLVRLHESPPLKGATGRVELHARRVDQSLEITLYSEAGDLVKDRNTFRFSPPVSAEETIVPPFSSGVAKETTGRKHADSAAYWLLVNFAIWTLVGILSATGLALDYRYKSTNGQIAWMQVTMNFFSWFLMAVLTPFFLWISNEFPLNRSRNLIFHAAACLLAWAFVSSSLNLWALGWSPWLDRLPRIFNAGLGNGFKADVYWGVMIVAFFSLRYRRSAREQLRELRLQNSLLRAEVEALQMQLHPHFLFNALNSVIELIHEDAQRAKQMLEHLHRFFDITIRNSSLQQIPLQQELDFLEYYLEMQKIRFRNRLSVKIEIDPEAAGSIVPALLLQPIVENCVRHGIDQRSSSVQISIRAIRQNDLLTLHIQDSGPGLCREDQRKVEGIGLSNTRARLDQLYGHNSSLELRNDPDGGLHVVVQIPNLQNSVLASMQ